MLKLMDKKEYSHNFMLKKCLFGPMENSSHLHQGDVLLTQNCLVDYSNILDGQVHSNLGIISLCLMRCIILMLLFV